MTMLRKVAMAFYRMTDIYSSLPQYHHQVILDGHSGKFAPDVHAEWPYRIVGAVSESDGCGHGC